MKIIWLHSHIQHWLGGTKFINEVCKRFIKDGHEVSLVVEDYSNDVKKMFEESGVVVRSLDSLTSNSTVYWLNFKKIIKRHILKLQQESKDYDVVISSMFPMNYVANFLGRRRVQIMYEPYAPFWDENFLKSISIRKRIWWYLIKKLYSQYDIDGTKKSDCLLTLSEHIRQWARRIYKKDSRVIYEGVDLDFFKQTYNRELAEKYNGRKIILHNTSFTSYKGTDFLIKAMPKIVRTVPEAKLLITYAINNEKKIRSIIESAKKEKFINNMEFLGFVDYALLPAYYSLAVVYIEPGIGRSMSLSNKEAMACGRPIIRGNDGPEEIIPGETGFGVNVYNTDEIAEKVIYLLKNPEIANLMGKKARERVRELFNWELVAQKILINFEGAS